MQETARTSSGLRPSRARWKFSVVLENPQLPYGYSFSVGCSAAYETSLRPGIFGLLTSNHDFRFVLFARFDCTSKLRKQRISPVFLASRATPAAQASPSARGSGSLHTEGTSWPKSASHAAIQPDWTT